MSPFFSPHRLKGTLKLSLNILLSNKRFWFMLINSKNVKISKRNSFSSNFPGIISSLVMSSSIYCPLFLKTSIPLGFTGWTEGRGWAGQKACGVPSEAAAQGRGGSAAEAAAGGWGGTKKGRSSVMMHRKEFLFILTWGGCSMLSALSLCSVAAAKLRRTGYGKKRRRLGENSSSRNI